MFVGLRKCLILTGSILLIVLTLTKAGYSQYNWTEPVQLSEGEIYPDTRHVAHAIGVDIHAFWVKNNEFMDMKWYFKTEYRNLAENACCILKENLKINRSL